MLDIVRDSTVGQILNWASSGRILPYPDQRKGYIVPSRFLESPSRPSSLQLPSLPAEPFPRSATGDVTLINEPGTLASPPKADIDLEKALDSKPEVIAEQPPYPFLVTWEENDSDNPRNWSRNKRLFVGFLISFLTFSVYIGSAIYTSSIPSLIATFGVSQVVATLGLTLFVAAYGIGPMFLAPLQEMPAFGRNPVYLAGLFLFVVFQFPVIYAKNIGTILAFRFLAGFVGSPALATGGASMMDIFEPLQAPYAIGVWSIGAVCGPTLGPVIGGFAAQAKGWQWPIYELLWISAFAFVVLAFFLPETSGETILIRRAERLRQLTGNPLIKTQYEVDRQESETVLSLATENFSRAIQLTLEPAVAFANLYIALVYAILYLWFEAFPLVFHDIYHFAYPGLPFVAFVASAIFTFIAYVLYQHYHLRPRVLNDPDFAPENRLELGLVAGAFIPISLLMFGWSARASVHWIVPVIGAALYLPGVFGLFQVILLYLSIGWPRYAASILAGNDLFRSTIASVFPLFGVAFFHRLGLGGASTLLAALSILMIPLLYLLIKYGAVLRARSAFAN
ncbi:putative caffeine resistance protein [Leucosporidium creatinivorum]|uniref:Putative caffeine resistance protein n=1 Tax=Leucosporidium creatinivorum TaxID=106004 RepID=A0A1Y2EU05_9BASI|nr:putative caffeine resistance protein [Leucosporidium creatinivorum]